MDTILARLAEIEADLTALAATPELSEDDAARFTALSEEFETLNEQRAAVAARNATVAAVRAAASDPHNVIAGAPTVLRSTDTEDPFDVSAIRGFGLPASELRGRALKAIETDNALTDARKEVATSLIERNRDAAGLVVATGSEHYRNAWLKSVAGRQHALTSEEMRALAVSDELRTALGLTGANGGYAVPVQVDPTVILTNSGSINPIRQLATVKTLSGTNTWQGLSTAGITAGYAAEGSQAGDDSPTFANPTIEAERADAFAFGSIEISQDWDSLADELLVLFADAKDQLEAVKFVSGAGAGSHEPLGLVAGLAAADPSMKVAAAGEAYAIGDAYKLIEAVPARFRSADRLSVLGAMNTFHATGKFQVQEDEKVFVREPANAANIFGRFLGYNAYEVSTMAPASDINPAANGTNDILVAGDIARAYTIVDRVGMSVELVPHIFGDAYRPTGQRGWFAFWRTGAGLVVPNAARVLRVSTTE